ncbi:hypothetical protein MGYG_03930 [Nannizzia gypsea CBS 118893]|uniref:Uncharacterized protein n=1 Tax=Arthroderma gypseum (strain ATCC MYA-4604 / CBS 118893) TaxID=535722 RepID=E4UUG1_ARTGP|nr:hypothetical protein MGYG_03930 [Nannizzia gypsea CBS 118893]EFR00928.1 hypothetical protein MGYG_03930 [Nannizzia gypsea CBS 118893]
MPGFAGLCAFDDRTAKTVSFLAVHKTRVRCILLLLRYLAASRPINHEIGTQGCPRRNRKKGGLDIAVVARWQLRLKLAISSGGREIGTNTYGVQVESEAVSVAETLQLCQERPAIKLLGAFAALGIVSLPTTLSPRLQRQEDGACPMGASLGLKCLVAWRKGLD